MKKLKRSNQNRNRKQSETDLILSSPKLLRGIERGVKEMREGKLLTRDGKEAFDWVSESKKADADIEKGRFHKFTSFKKALQWLKRNESKLFGRYSSGKKDLSSKRKKYLLQILLQKNGRQIASQLASKNISEKEILDDFKKYKGERRKAAEDKRDIALAKETLKSAKFVSQKYFDKYLNKRLS